MLIRDQIDVDGLAGDADGQGGERELFRVHADGVRLPDREPAEAVRPEPVRHRRAGLAGGVRQRDSGVRHALPR